MGQREGRQHLVGDGFKADFVQRSGNTEDDPKVLIHQIAGHIQTKEDHTEQLCDPGTRVETVYLFGARHLDVM